MVKFFKVAGGLLALGGLLLVLATGCRLLFLRRYSVPTPAPVLPPGARVISTVDGDWAGDVEIRFVAPGKRPADVLFEVSRDNSNFGEYYDEPNRVSQTNGGDWNEIRYEPDGGYVFVRRLDK